VHGLVSRGQVTMMHSCTSRHTLFR